MTMKDAEKGRVLWTESEWDNGVSAQPFASSITPASNGQEASNAFLNSVDEAISKSPYAPGPTNIYKIRVQTNVWDIRSSEVKTPPPMFPVGSTPARAPQYPGRAYATA